MSRLLRDFSIGALVLLLTSGVVSAQATAELNGLVTGDDARDLTTRVAAT